MRVHFCFLTLDWFPFLHAPPRVLQSIHLWDGLLGTSYSLSVSLFVLIDPVLDHEAKKRSDFGIFGIRIPKGDGGDLVNFTELYRRQTTATQTPSVVCYFNEVYFILLILFSTYACFGFSCSACLSKSCTPPSRG